MSLLKASALGFAFSYLEMKRSRSVSQISLRGSQFFKYCRRSVIAISTSKTLKNYDKEIFFVIQRVDDFLFQYFFCNLGLGGVSLGLFDIPEIPHNVLLVSALHFWYCKLESNQKPLKYCIKSRNKDHCATERSQKYSCSFKKRDIIKKTLLYITFLI